MKKITVPTREQVSTGSQEIFDLLQKRLGKVPNLYATIGYSANALKGFLEFEKTLNGGVFHPKEREAISLAVSEVNACTYCLSAHTMAALKLGYTQDETIAIRKGTAGDAKLDAVVKLAQAIATNKGHAAPELIEVFFAAGYKEDGLMELMGLVVVRTFTNYAYALTDVPVDFPVVEPLS
ncbi:carboxymuconolactone decarboxylase family protein [Chitinophaga agri]|uniref:Carboxymuconolactone decarboxylase family protein n=1 Tax=Chitinophaga agri TaxID=2703787 RepID=A0A6B9ZQE7_9BACT|nr:carboxymuconolactone decarboxylase family protein [Chitinophaga agri]QHS63675.1 carboxymuconolactone decarboxylase family protein [Chitinophaga agri]